MTEWTERKNTRRRRNGDGLLLHHRRLPHPGAGVEADRRRKHHTRFKVGKIKLESIDSSLVIKELCRPSSLLLPQMWKHNERSAKEAPLLRPPLPPRHLHRPHPAMKRQRGRKAKPRKVRRRRKRRSWRNRGRRRKRRKRSWRRRKQRWCCPNLQWRNLHLSRRCGRLMRGQWSSDLVGHYMTLHCDTRCTSLHFNSPSGCLNKEEGS